MTLAFSTALNGKLTHFPEKILNGLVNNELIKVSAYREYASNLKQNLYNWIANDKITTFRTDEKQRWKPGMLIHFVINNRTKYRYQFAPTTPLISKQRVIIHYWYNQTTECFDDPAIYIDGKEIKGLALEKLAINDGFRNSKDFFNYFSENWAGYVLHWTDLKY